MYACPRVGASLLRAAFQRKMCRRRVYPDVPKPCGSEPARDGCVSGDLGFVGVHIRFLGNGRYGFRPYGGLLGRAPSNQAPAPLTYGGSLMLAMPSLRSCSVGPLPSAIHGRRQLNPHPCRFAHCAAPALGLPTRQIKVNNQINSQVNSQINSQINSQARRPDFGNTHSSV